jgi:putative resolvase
MDNYIGGKQASKILGVHQKTLYNWDELGIIDVMRMPGGKRLYNVDKFIRERTLTQTDGMEKDEIVEEVEEEITVKTKFCYARVSSFGQKEDLERQKSMLKKLYPDHKMITDIGSGINLNRRGLRRIIKLGIEGKVEELVVVHRDRLTRFGYELIEDIIKDYSKGKIVVVEEKIDIEPEEELVKDVLTLMNVFVARMNGLRKYKKNKDKKDNK